ncbi:hypothetical protein SNEBB_003651 [Seison nebaliae]|nr:hypothetical protein SNEBB_003651 [Seison nebaliae]
MCMYDPINRLEDERQGHRRDKRVATFGKKGKRRGGRRTFKKKNRPKKSKKTPRKQASTKLFKSTTEIVMTTIPSTIPLPTTTHTVPTTTSMEIILPNFNDETTTIREDESTTFINPFDITEAFNENMLYTLGSFYENPNNIDKKSPNIMPTSIAKVIDRKPPIEKKRVEKSSKITLCFIFCVLPLICYFYGENRRVRIFERNMINQLISYRKVSPSKNKPHKFQNNDNSNNFQENDPSDSEFVDYGQEEFYEYQSNDAKNKQNIQNFEESPVQSQNDRWEELNQQQQQQSEQQNNNDYGNVDNSEFFPQTNDQNVQNNDYQTQQLDSVASTSNDDFQPLQNDEQFQKSKPVQEYQEDVNNKVSRSILDGELDSDNDEYDMTDYLPDEELLMEEANNPVKADTASDMMDSVEFSEPEQLMKEGEESREQLAEFVDQDVEQIDDLSNEEALKLLNDEQEEVYKELEQSEQIEQSRQMEVKETPIKEYSMNFIKQKIQPKKQRVATTAPKIKPEPSKSSDDDLALMNFMFKSSEKKKEKEKKVNENKGLFFGNFDTKFDGNEVVPKVKTNALPKKTSNLDISKNKYLDNLLSQLGKPKTTTPKPTQKPSMFLSMIGESAMNAISKYDKMFNGHEEPTQPEKITEKTTEKKLKKLILHKNKDMEEKKENKVMEHQRMKLPSARKFQPYLLRKFLRKMNENKRKPSGKSVRVFEGGQKNVKEERPRKLRRKLHGRKKKFRLARRRRIRQQKSKKELKQLMRRLRKKHRQDRKFSHLFKRLDRTFDFQKRFLIRRHTRNANQ